jgi:arylsulfatase A-like enzyme
MRWPGKIPAGTTSDDPAMNIDILPTLAARIGVELPSKRIDGKDIWPLLSGEEGAVNPHDSYLFYYKNNELHAVVAGPWKLILPHEYRTLPEGKRGEGGIPVPYASASTELELYHLGDDISESVNLADRHPEKVTELMIQVEAARADLGDRLVDRVGSGTRQPGILSDVELSELKKRHWPDPN